MAGLNTNIAEFRIEKSTFANGYGRGGFHFDMKYSYLHVAQGQLN